MSKKQKKIIAIVGFLILGIIVGLLVKYCIDLKEKREQEEEHRRLMDESIQEINYINENSYFGEIELMGPIVGSYSTEVGSNFRDGEIHLGEYFCWTFNEAYGVTNIYIENSIAHVLGITLGDSYYTAVRLLENRGYQYYKQSEDGIRGDGEGTKYAYQKGYVHIFITSSEDGVIKEISIVIWDPSVDHRRGFQKTMYRVEQELKKQRKIVYCVSFVVVLGFLLAKGYIRYRNQNNKER